MVETIKKNTTTVKGAVPSRHVIPVFAGDKLLKGYALDDQDKLWILDVEDNFVLAPTKEMRAVDKAFHCLRVGFSWCQPERDYMSLEQIILSSRAHRAEYEERYGRVVVPVTRFREDVKGSYKIVVPVYIGYRAVPNFYMDVFDNSLYYLKDGILTDTNGAVINGQLFPAQQLINSTISFYCYADMCARFQQGMLFQSSACSLSEVAERGPLWCAGRYLGASELQQMVLHVPPVSNATRSEAGLQQPSWNWKPEVDAPVNDLDVQTAVLYIRSAMMVRGFDAHQIDFATNEFVRLCQTRQTQWPATAPVFNVNNNPRWTGTMS